MYQVVLRIVSRYAPIVTLPVAVVLGFIGYSIESSVSSRKTPALDKGIAQLRQERLLNDVAMGTPVETPKTPANIFERNASAQLRWKQLTHSLSPLLYPKNTTKRTEISPEHLNFFLLILNSLSLSLPLLICLINEWICFLGHISLQFRLFLYITQYSWLV